MHHRPLSLAAVFVPFVVLFILPTHGFVPSSLECGTADDVVDATFPFTLSAVSDDEVVSQTYIWQNKDPEFRYSLKVRNYEESYYTSRFLNLHEINGSQTTVVARFETFDLENATWEAVTTKTSDCTGFYLKTVLSNQAILELSWTVFNSDHNIPYGTMNTVVQKNSCHGRYFLTNYPYLYSNISSPSIEAFLSFGTPLPLNQNWEQILPPEGVPENAANPNATTWPAPVEALSIVNGVTPQQRGYIINEMTQYDSFMNFALLNDEETLVQQRSIVHSLGPGLKPLSFTKYETFLANFSSTSDVLIYDSRFARVINVTLIDDDGGAQVPASFVNFWVVLVCIISMLFW
eukprot:TRINITY_DN2344_c0_g1_i1.p1 TRINITY_DN2344_c0_g1~~TRINITY_DN2344_c0_g1_i1.p1  ORF type:complete len:348 (-),score=43.33 TRINITY_DN2344_c0_g1_i1:66-1109(-)